MQPPKRWSGVHGFTTFVHQSVCILNQVFLCISGLTCDTRWKQAQWSWWCAILLGFSKRWKPALKSNGPQESDWVPPSTTASSCADLSRRLWDTVEQSFENGSMFAVVFVLSSWLLCFCLESVFVLWMCGMSSLFVFQLFFQRFYFCCHNWGNSSVIICKFVCRIYCWLRVGAVTE